MNRLGLVLVLFAALSGSLASGCNNSKRIYATCYCAPVTSVTVTVVTTRCAPCRARSEAPPFDDDGKPGKGPKNH